MYNSINSGFFTSKMKCLFAILLLFVVASPGLCARITPHVDPSFNVVDYGATGNGQIDDSQAFLKAWQDVCSATQGNPTLLIPKGKTFMLQPVSFDGPCKPATLNIMLQGTIIAPNSVEAWKRPNNFNNAWIQFSGISGLVINGGGKIDGQGAAWWNLLKSDNERPGALHFHKCENLTLSSLTHLNSPRNHIGINVCNGVHISSLHIIAPANSPNTDGIDISGSSNITVQDSKMETGDDCIAINGGSSFINITSVYCGPGHGISIGSLGKNGAFDTVEQVHVKSCTFDRTSNGARIKTWVGGAGYARKIIFEDIILVEAKNPVIIDQHYDAFNSVAEAVKVSDITYRNVRGTSSSRDAIQLNCDHNIGCTDIVMEGIDITSADGENIFASCTNAHGTSSLCIPNVPCLSQV